MPLYAYECSRCELGTDTVNSIDERHSGAPSCHCKRKMVLVISPVRGIVRFPAAGGHEYISPTSGKAITTQRQRTEDLKRSGCRPYEGFESESRQAASVRAAEEKKSDAKLHESVSRAYYALSPKKRAHLAA